MKIIKEEEEDEIKVRQFEEVQLDVHFPDENLVNDRWWEYVLCSMSSRIFLVIIASCVIGVTIPIIFFWLVGNDDGHMDNFGNCLVNIDHRFQYEINQIDDDYNSLENCSMHASGCWENDDTVQYKFKCFHSIPSAFQYYVSGPANYILKNSKNAKQNPSPKVGDGSDLMDYSVEIDIQPVEEVDSSLMKYKSRITWHTSDILTIQFLDPNSASDFSTEQIELDQLQSQDKIDGASEFKIEFSDAQNDFFYIRIGRINNNDDGRETIFDTRLGPLKIYKNSFTFSTVLPSRHFYGLNGGQGASIFGATIVDGVNTIGQNELPFYMVREESGKMHGVLIETMFPFVAQVIDGPGVMFAFERTQEEISLPMTLKLFVGPSATDVLNQFSSYIQQEILLPPYWGLGLHLCRKATTSRETLNQILKLNYPDEPELAIPYDSDCISENLRNPLEIDSTRFNSTELDVIMNELQGSDPDNPRRRLLLSQRLIQSISEVTPENMQMFILNEKDEPFIGVFDKKSVNYFSIFNEKAKREIEKRFQVPRGKLFDGVVLIDNLPKHENASVDYEKARLQYRNSRIQSNFSSTTWGTVGPNSRHLKPVITNNGTEEPLASVVQHLELSNVYGEESLKFFSEMMTRHMFSSQFIRRRRTIVSTSSMWTKSFTHGAFNGIDVPFTWEGLRNSLSSALRYFMFNPFGGIPACGSYQIDEDVPFDQNLCLRWFQVSLLFPFVRNTYDSTNTNSSRGPQDLNKSYQRHLIRNIRDRYAYNPYYYTLFYEYTVKNSVPPITPLSFYYQDNANETFPILDQFMIGQALMACPLVFSGTSRQVYFPKGTAWYTMDGELASDSKDVGQNLHVSALINYIPLFIRDGHIIPTLLNTDALTAEESRSKSGNYTLIGTYPSSQFGTLLSKGSLYMDDGVLLSSEKPEYDLITFQLNVTHFVITSTIVPCTLSTTTLSTVIDEIRIIGIPKKPNSVWNSVTGLSLPRKSVVFDSERNVLRLLSLNIDWCDEEQVILYWDPL